MKNYDQFVSLLKKEVVPALGCTEPTAIAYAAAKAREVLGEMPEKVELTLSGNIIKNAMGVGIPGTGMKGSNIATAVGIVAGDSSRKLEVLTDISKDKVEEAKKLIENPNFISLEIAKVPNKLYIKAKVIKGDRWASVEIKDFHTAITLIEKNGEVFFKANCDEAVENITCAPTVKTEDKSFITVASIFDFAENVDINELEFLNKVIEVNGAIAEEGIKNPWGLQVGRTRLNNINSGMVGDTLETYSIAMTAAASDARMAGSTLPVMTNSGSGNQGLTASVPVIAAAKKLNSSQEELLRALALSELIAIHMKSHLGRLSALCGCVLASTGSSCGISYLLGGKLPELEGTIKNILGNITGMFCDGAKPGCSLKIATGVSAGIQGALLAKDGIIIGSDEGIISESIEDTIRDACAIGRDAMSETDKMILEIMINKTEK
ncbi:MAG: serine dehydratase subunit alpha family protein [Fusobacteriaceae bacterium]